MRSLVVVPSLPIPTDNGDALYAMSLLGALSRLGDSTILTVERATSRSEDTVEFRRRLPSAKIVTYPPRALNAGKGLSSKTIRWTRGLLTGVPPWISQQYSRELSRDLEAISSPFDIQVLIAAAAGIYALSSPLRPWHWDIHNVMTVSAQDEIRDRRGVGRAKSLASYRMSRRFESRVLARVKTVSVTSEEEADRLRGSFGRSPDLVLKPAVDLSPAVWTLEAGADRILWLGSLAYRSNVVGLFHLLNRARAVLEANRWKVRVVGGGETEDVVRRLKADPAVEFLGFRDDLTSAVRGVRAAVVPLWTGAGVKLKTLTLMALGIPIATTPVGREGIPADVMLCVRNDALELIQEIAGSSDQSLMGAGQRGRHAVAKLFSNEAFADLVAEFFSSTQTR